VIFSEFNSKTNLLLKENFVFYFRQYCKLTGLVSSAPVVVAVVITVIAIAVIPVAIFPVAVIIITVTVISAGIITVAVIPVVIIAAVKPAWIIEIMFIIPVFIRPLYGNRFMAVIPAPAIPVVSVIPAVSPGACTGFIHDHC